MAILVAENCEGITLPDPFYFGFAEDNKSLLVGFRLDKKAKYERSTGAPYSFVRLLKRLADEPDVVRIVYGENIYIIPFEGDEQNLLKGVAFEDDILYMAFGNTERLKQLLLDEEGLDPDKVEGFSVAIDQIGCKCSPQIINSGEIASEDCQKNADREIEALTTIAQILATHYSLIDRPRGGWEALGGNPYDKIIKEYEELLRG